jgi:hypothetical protein
MFMFGKNCFSGYRHHWDFRWHAVFLLI